MIKQYIYIILFFTGSLFSQKDYIPIKNSQPSDKTLTIIATANIKGEVDPCG